MNQDNSAPLQPSLTIDLPGLSAEHIPLTLRLIQPGEFMMGERSQYAQEQPVHQVLIDQPFYLGVCPVTQAQFAAWTCTEAYPAWFGAQREQIRATSTDNTAEPHRNHFADQPDHPAEQVTWWEALAFTDWLNANGLVPNGWQAKLPHEAHWEYACRAGTRSRYWAGDAESDLAEVGWYGGNAEGATHRVGELEKPNPWGLHDMHGNVREWCLDFYDPSRYRRRVPATVWHPVLSASDCEPQGVAPILQAVAEQMARYARGDTVVVAADADGLQWLKAIAVDRVNAGDSSWKVVLDASLSALRKGQDVRWPDPPLAKQLCSLFQGVVDSQSGGQAARVLRGGGWSDAAVICRAADRIWYLPGGRNRYCGFRLALVPGPQVRPPGGTPGEVSRAQGQGEGSEAPIVPRGGAVR